MNLTVSTLCACALATSALGASITTLGLGRAESISDNGSVVAGMNGNTMWVWTAGGGLASVPASNPITAVISGNGNVLAGVTADENNNFRQCHQPFPLTGAGWQFVPYVVDGTCADSWISSSVAVSGDGSVLAGAMPNAGCVGVDVATTWSVADGVQEWYSPYGSVSRIDGISADGRTMFGGHYTEIEGSGMHHGCIWYADGTFEPISMTVFHGALSAMNRAGTIFAGNWDPATGNAYTWTAAGGFRDLGAIDGMEFVFNKRPTSMTDDGSVVIGVAGDFWSMSPVIWIDGQGGQPLKTYLQNLGVSGIDDYYFQSAAAITPDGRYIVGDYMLDDGTFNTYAYLVDLQGEGGPVCPADFNQDGGVDGADVEAFYAAWENSLPDADVNQDGGVDGGDVETFFAAWEAGGCA